ncbi:TraR/DksA C4-type zinc finger protein [Candidatus Calescamantes bacterium]|nr:TraR/DksA C4-type zinc finger protein [Candidatus Calescamantes bacterium]
MLDRKILEELKAKLLKMKENISKELRELEKDTMEKSLKEASGELSSYSIHFADLGSDASERDKEFDVLETEEKIIEEIEKALKRMEKGEYGICENCGKEIPLERLIAIPYATKCRECQEKEEKGEV